ncbi:glycosyltransferase [Streptomyces sp. NPDC001455]|uniref:glycosyltransferase n=1 Tax=Streptomyces sp. NPDC001455 TaxID=3154518 RepID=UPI00332C41FD
MRVLFASTRGSGHFDPLVPFIDACTARGDDVLVVAPPGLEALLASRPQPYRIGANPPDDELQPMMDRLRRLPPDEGVSLMTREVFGRLYPDALLPALDEACREWRPDLVLHETYEPASVVAAERHGVPHARVAICAAGFARAGDPLLDAALDRYGPGIADRLRSSPYLTRLPASLDPSPYPVTHRYHVPGPHTAPSQERHGGEEPLVYLTLGSEVGALPTAPDLFRALLDAMDGLPVRALLTVGRGTDPDSLGPLPPGVRVERWVPQDDVLGSASAVVCHGGSGTVYGALAAGLPLVCVPLFADQPFNAGLVVEAGAGLAVTPAIGSAGAAVTFGGDDVSRIRSAVEQVLKDPAYRTRAEQLADETRATATCAQLLGLLDPRD